MPQRPNTVFDFLERLVICEPVFLDTGCFEWSGYIDKYGYPQASMGDKPVRIHRKVYEHFKGPVPEGRVIDHLCRNRKCCNPGHLRAATISENALNSDMVGKHELRKTHCPQGHSYSGDNLLIHKDGKRRCRVCHIAKCRRAGKRYRLKQRQAL
jgi:hypothetical protein